MISMMEIEENVKKSISDLIFLLTELLFPKVCVVNKLVIKRLLSLLTKG